MPTLEQYIQALQNQANNVNTVQLKSSDGSLTPPMSIRAAAEYLYNGTKPESRTLPSEEITAKRDREWAENEAKRQTEQARAQANEYNTRSFYTDVVLPSLTFGMSEYIPGLKGNTNMATGPLSAAVVASQRSPVSRLFWPAAIASGLWGWYANTHEPPAYYSSTSPYTMLDEAPATPAQPEPAQPATPEGTSGSTQTGSQAGGGAAPANPDPKDDKNKKSKISSWAKELRPIYGYSKTNWGWNIPRIVRDATYANWGIPTIANGITWLNTGKTPVKQPLTSYIPGVFEDNSVEVDTLQQRVLPNGQVVYIQPGDSLPQGTTNQVDSNYYASPEEKVDPSQIIHLE